MIFQNCLGLLTNIHGSVVLKNEFRASFSATLYWAAVNLYASHCDSELDNFADRNKRFFLLHNLFNERLYYGAFLLDVIVLIGTKSLNKEATFPLNKFQFSLTDLSSKPSKKLSRNEASSQFIASKSALL